MSRIIERHPNGKGSVMTLDIFGREIKLLVADARYRSIQTWGLYNIEIPEMQLFKGYARFINPANDYENFDDRYKPLEYNLTDPELQALFPAFKTDNLAHINTEILAKYKDTDAAKWCREHGFDLPNIYELMTIYLEADRLDALDPTVDSYPDFALGIKNPNGRFCLDGLASVWSSTSISERNACVVNFTGHVDYSDKGFNASVVPVKEL